VDAQCEGHDSDNGCGGHAAGDNDLVGFLGFHFEVLIWFGEWVESAGSKSRPATA
jgi:hypothetical protein